MKKIIKLTESKLHRMIENSVRQILKESKISLKNTIFVAYGTDTFDVNKFKPYDNKRTVDFGMNKPIGGLWASPLNSECGWGEWCSKNEFAINSLDKHFLFKLTPNAKIYIIDSKEDIINISTQKDYWGGTNVMDFQKLINDGYDGIFVTSNAIGKFRFHVEKGYGNLNVWDVESLCVFNEKVIQPIEENAFDKERVPRYEMDDEYDMFDTAQEKKKLQMSSDFGKYSNRNITSDMSSFFNGKHPSILAQGHGNNKETQLARKFNGTIKSGL